MKFRSSRALPAAVQMEICRPSEQELRLVLPGAPRTKKNSRQRRRVGTKVKDIPSAPWLAWRDRVVPELQLRLRAARLGNIAQPVNCRALFFRDAHRGDACGYYQGLADILEEAGVVVDDAHIVSWDGSRMRKDAARPRVELLLSVAEDPNAE